MTDLIRAAQAEQALRSAHVNPRWRMAYHVMAPAGWINDPNGLTWFAGEYHLFYQHNPYSTEWGPIHWGHVVSADLVHWRHEGVALAPGDTYDRHGCHSGSAVDNDGELTLIYTGHDYADPDPLTRDVDQFTQTQNIAVSRDGTTFVKYPGNPVLAHPPADSTHHFRDPKVWRHEDHWYMVLGNGAQDGAGRALLYRSSDLRAWEYLGVLAESDGSTGFMWECPDLFELDGRHVLLLSPMGISTSLGGTQPEFHAGSLIGSFDYATHRLTHEAYAEMDHGHDFYAVQTMRTPDGRRVAVGWMKACESGMSERRDGWAGALTVPRELHLTADDRLTMQPVAELELLRRTVVLAASMPVDGVLDTGVSVGAADILIDMDLSGSAARQVGFELVAGGASVVRVVLDRVAEQLVLDRGGVDGIRRATLDAGDRLQLRIYVDRSSIEVFTGSGLVTMTSRIYPATTPTLRLVSDGGVTQFGVDLFDLADVWRP